jgi:AmmeMemoRadiSam system protein B
VIKELKSKGNFATMSVSQDEDEHSLEMHLPYIYSIFFHCSSPNPVPEERKLSTVPPLVPIMVGATNASKEKEYGRLLAPYVANPDNLFIISSDFCHWYFDSFDYF